MNFRYQCLQSMLIILLWQITELLKGYQKQMARFCFIHCNKGHSELLLLGDIKHLPYSPDLFPRDSVKKNHGR